VDEGIKVDIQPLLRIALEESVKLQSHYAQMLNVYDGGDRMTFRDGDAWITRLIAIGKIPTQLLHP
jgi:hypothetical protein